MSIKSKLLLVFTIITLPVFSNAFVGNFSKTNPEWMPRMNGQNVQMKYEVSQQGNTVHFKDTGLDIVYKLDLSQSIYELPQQDIDKVINKNPELSQHLKGITIANYLVTDRSLKADIIYAFIYDTTFGKFTFDITSRISFQINEQHSEVTFSNGQSKLTDIQMMLLGRDISATDTLKAPKYVLAIVLDLIIRATVTASDKNYYIHR